MQHGKESTPEDMALMYPQRGFVMPVHHRDAGRAPMAGRAKNSDHALRAGGSTSRRPRGRGLSKCNKFLVTFSVFDTLTLSAYRHLLKISVIIIIATNADLPMK